MAPTLLYVSVSPNGPNSSSRNVGETYVAAWKAAHPDGKVVERDLAANPLPVLDGEAIYAGYTPEEARSPSAKAKFAARMELINELLSADEVLVATPLWNWNVPGVLKNYVDLIIVPGVCDGDGTNKLAGKRVTCVVAMGGGGYSTEGKHRFGWDGATGYLRNVFTALGSTDVETLNCQWGLAGIVPAMAELVPVKAAELEAAKAAAAKRAGA